MGGGQLLPSFTRGGGGARGRARYCTLPPSHALTYLHICTPYTSIHKSAERWSIFHNGEMAHGLIKCLRLFQNQVQFPESSSGGTQNYLTLEDPMHSSGLCGHQYLHPQHTHKHIHPNKKSCKKSISTSVTMF